MKSMQSLGHSIRFFIQVLCAVPVNRQDYRQIIDQCWSASVLSLLIIGISAVFVGLVLSMQLAIMLERFGSVDWVSKVVCLTIMRELGPVMTALLFISRFASSVAAEIGLMQATEQIISLKAMAVDPLRYVLFPRLLAGLIGLPTLFLIFTSLSILGAYFMMVNILGHDGHLFWLNVSDGVYYADLRLGLLKSFIFAMIVMLISLYQGYFVNHNPKSVAMASTKTVVYASLMVLISDFLVTAFWLQGDL
ncbi:MAG TPA: ABC transporter permease [Gammaproteobacteria bacterium]|nr:ABC transporter permease [Gammaproteobacteria bacterium]